jgi:signal transduction histidine kinase
MRKISTLLSHFLPQSSHWTVIRHRKSAILVFTHFFILVALVGLVVLSKAIATTALIPAFLGIPAIICSLYYFKKIGHINVSGNVLSIIWFVILVPILFYTGGINSSFMPWLYSVILVMVMVENYKWATFWFTMASITCCVFYIGGLFYPHINISICNETDTFISYVTVGFFMFTNLLVFEKHQVLVIKILKEKNIQLKNQKREIDKHVEALEKMQNQLTSSNQELQIFAHVASHDLKEPLRMISMYVKLLEKKLAHLLDGKTQDFMFYTIDGVNRMQKLLDNLLLYSMMGKNDVKTEPIDLNETIVIVLQNLTVLIQETNATIHFANLPHITATGTEMTQLFQNIMANALKFRKKHIEPVISIEYTETETEHILSISDNGIGIKEADKERVFNIFTRLNNRSDFEGTGIGLATCKKIVANMDGRIWLTSTEGVGTSFYFAFPKIEIPIIVIENEAVTLPWPIKQRLAEPQLV